MIASSFCTHVVYSTKFHKGLPLILLLLSLLQAHTSRKKKKMKLKRRRTDKNKQILSLKNNHKGYISSRLARMKRYRSMYLEMASHEPYFNAFFLIHDTMCTDALDTYFIE